MNVISSAASSLPRNTRLPIIALCAVIAFFGLSELATQAWYAWQESKREVTQPWKVDWPTEKDAEARGFLRFQERALTSAEQELLRYQTGHAANWRSPEGAAWTAFYFTWPLDYRLNQMDLVHNPTVCLPAAGLNLVRSLPETEQTIGGETVKMHGWEFEREGQQIYVFVATRWDRKFDLFNYQSGDWRMRLGNVWRAVIGNRGNALQTLELVGMGFRSAEDATQHAAEELARLSAP